MYKIYMEKVKNLIKEGFLDICVNINSKVEASLKRAAKEEKQIQSAFVLDILTKNIDIAKKTCSPLCQDTGMAVIFCEIGQEVALCGGNLTDAINQGVREAYAEGYFRKSVLDPISRENTQDNTPAIIHYDIVEGKNLTLKIMAKGFGSENMSRLFMLSPSKGTEGIIDGVVSAIKEAGSNPCPPVIVGVGIGGTMEKACILSKKALFRDIDSENKDFSLNKMENQIKDKINNLKIGAGGYGGELTALKVLIEKFPTHIAGLPVAVTVQCHAVRHKEIIIE